MTDLQLVTLAITLLAIFAALYGNRNAVEDMRDVLRAEINSVQSGMGLKLRSATGEIHLILQRIENKLDHFSEIQASHNERITRLERRG